MPGEFHTNEVTLFLAKRFPYAAQCFAQEAASKFGDTTPTQFVSNWCQYYFPSPTGFDIFRQLERSVTQLTKIS